jgi:methionine-rich copper-binding protein CopC
MPVLAWAHAYLVKSIPARRAILFKAPVRIQLWFNERLEPRFSTLSVTDSSGKRVDLDNSKVADEDPKQLSVEVRSLPAGVYVIKFRVLSVDGHVVEDQFPFTIRRVVKSNDEPG